MKAIIYVQALSWLTLVNLLLNSCSSPDKVVSSNVVQKKKYTKGWHVNTVAKSPKTKITKNDFIPSGNQEHKYYETESDEHVAHQYYEDSANDLTASTENEVIPLIAHNVLFRNEPENKQTRKIIKQVEGCDEIIFKNGEIISAKVTEVGIKEIKYNKCDSLSGPTYSVLKSEVFLIKYANGTKDVFIEKSNEPSNTSKVDTSGVRIDPIAISSLVFGISGIFISLALSSLVGMLFGVFGILFGCISLGRIKKNPEKYIGKGLAITGLVTGTVLIVVTVALLILLSLFY